MRIPSGKVDIAIYFVALDAALTTRVTGLSSFTVYRSRNGAAEAAYTTPTVTEIDATNMPGVYSLLIDEDTTIASTSDSEEYAVHITATGMSPVTRTIELYRRDTTSGATLTTADVTAIKAKTDQLTFGTANRVNAQTYGMEADVITSTALATSAVTEINTGIATAASITTLTAYVDTEVASILAAVDTEVAAIKAKTDNLPVAPAAVGDIPTAATIADAVWDESLVGHVSDANSAGFHLDNVESQVGGMVLSGVSVYSGSVAFIVDSVWDEATSGHTTSGTFGEQAKTDIDAIKAKTDSLTFTVAGQADANIQSVNEVTVTGAGTGGSPWGP